MSAPRLTEPIAADFRPPVRAVPFQPPPPRAPSPWLGWMVLAISAVVVTGGGWALVRVLDGRAREPVQPLLATVAPPAAPLPPGEPPAGSARRVMTSATTPAPRAPSTRPVSPARRPKPPAPTEILDPWGYD